MGRMACRKAQTTCPLWSYQAKRSNASDLHLMQADGGGGW
jgi:hypothetical protein